MNMDAVVNQPLAVLGGPKAVNIDPAAAKALFHWPIVTEEDERAVLEVLRAGSMSGTGLTVTFEKEFAAWQGTQFALASCNGTAALLQAMFAVGLGRGDEMIVPSITYWASALQSLMLGATPVFADIDPVTLCIDPASLERCITPRTKAVMLVHYCGHPCDMDRILPIIRQHNLKLIEDVSHAQGALYKGRKVGTFGDVAAMSMMGGKSFAVGEGGMLVTNERRYYERAIAFGAYERIKAEVTDPQLKAVAGPEGFVCGLPLGAMKGRLNQTCAAMGRVQLKHYDARCAAIQAAMNRYWDLLADLPGFKPHRPQVNGWRDSTMGGWYNPLGRYFPEELGGLPLEKFIAAVQAEGGNMGRGINFPLHTHPVLHQADIFHDGKPTRIAFSNRDVRERPDALPVSQVIGNRACGIPWFKHDRPEMIEQYAAAVRKVILQHEKLLETVSV